jgi:hypothetical protein
MTGGRVTRLARDPTVRRRVACILDQGASSLSNVVVFVLAARTLPPTAVGAFGIAMLGYQLVLGGVRAMVGEPLLSGYSHLGPTARRQVSADLLGSAFFLSLVASALTAGLSWVFGGITGAALLALAVILPFVVMQDTWRFVLIIDRAAAALATDVLWLVLVLVVLTQAPAGADVAWFVYAWGITGGVSALGAHLLGWGLAARPHPWRWIVQHRDMAGRFFGEFVTANATAHLSTAGLSAVSGLVAVGAAKASQVFFGPITTAHNALALVVVPEGARSRDDPRRLRRMMYIVAAVISLLALLWTVVGAFLPDRWGASLFGATWPAVSELMLPMGLGLVAAGVASAGLIGLRALGDAQRSLQARLASAPPLALLPLAGAVADDAVGFVVGLGVARLVSAVIWWQMFSRSLSASQAHRGDAAAEIGPLDEATLEVEVAAW